MRSKYKTTQYKKLRAALLFAADEKGFAKISYPELAKLSGIGLRSVKRIMKELEIEGFVVISRSIGRGLSNDYYLPKEK